MINLESLLRQAYFDGNYETLKFLLEKSSNVQMDYVNIFKICIIHHTRSLDIYWEANYKSHMVLKTLIEHGINLKFHDEYCLRSLCANGVTGMVKMLLDQGSDISIMDNEPIRQASLNNHAQTVYLLLSKGADPTKIHKDSSQRVKELVDIYVSQDELKLMNFKFC